MLRSSSVLSFQSTVSDVNVVARARAKVPLAAQLTLHGRTDLVHCAQVIDEVALVEHALATELALHLSAQNGSSNFLVNMPKRSCNAFSAVL